MSFRYGEAVKEAARRSFPRKRASIFSAQCPISIKETPVSGYGACFA